MAVPTENVTCIEYVEDGSATETLSNKNLVSVLNSGDVNFTISTNNEVETLTLATGQSITLQSSAGFVLPDVDIIFGEGGGTAQVIFN